MISPKNKIASKSSPTLKAGFTLVELLIVAGITAFITTFLLLNFSRSKINFNEAVAGFKSSLRIAQTKAISSTKYNNKIRCGFGIRYVNNTSYAIYVGENATTHNCQAQNKDFDPVVDNPDTDVEIELIKFADPTLEFKTQFRAIFFEPPDPKTFIIDSGGTVHNEPNYSININVGKVGGTCPQDCKTLNVSTSGKIE